MTSIDKWDQSFLKLAQHISTFSKDPSPKMGAVIVDRFYGIVSTRYNGFARDIEDSQERLQNRALKYRMVVHCEINTLVFAQRDLSGCTLYTCLPTARSFFHPSRRP